MLNIPGKLTATSQSRIVDLFCFAIFLEIHTFFANAIGRIILGASSLDTAFVYCILFFLFCRALPDLFKKTDGRHLVMATAVLLFITLSYLLNGKLNVPEYKSVIRTAYTSVIAGFFLGSAVTDFEVLEKKLVKITPVIALEMIISFLIYHFIFNTEWGTGAMGLSYKLLIPAVLTLYCLFKEFNIWHFALLAALLVIMLLQGSRGPLVSVFSFAVLYQIINFSGSRKRVLINITALLIPSILFITNIDKMLNWIMSLSSKYGFYSKFLRVMNDGNFFEANGRDIIASEAKEIILKNPLGNGFFAERPIIGTYCHNIFLEFLVDFGIVIGTILIVAYVFGIIRKLRSKSFAEKNVINIMFCAFLIKLFFSGSFWIETSFFIFVSFLVRPNCQVQKQEDLKNNETCSYS